MYMYGTFDDSQFIHHSVEDLEHSEHSHWNGSKFQKLGFNQFWKKTTNIVYQRKRALPVLGSY